MLEDILVENKAVPNVMNVGVCAMFGHQRIQDL
jgi:hypothetical protein